MNRGSSQNCIKTYASVSKLSNQAMGTYVRFGLSNKLASRLTELKWKLEALNKKLLPIMLKNRDLFAILPKKTHCNKVESYLTAVVHKIDVGNQQLQALIFAPSKKDVLFIFNKCNDLVQSLNIKILQSTSDTGLNKDAADLKKGTHVLIVTPSRALNLWKIVGDATKSLRVIIIDGDLEIFSDSNRREAVLHFLSSTKLQFFIFSTEKLGKYEDCIEKYLSDPYTHISEDQQIVEVTKKAERENYVESLRSQKRSNVPLKSDVKDNKSNITNFNIAKDYQTVPKMSMKFNADQNAYVSFQEFGLNSELLKRISELNRAPICIDKVILPIVLNNENIFVLIKRRNFDKVPTYLVSVLNRINPIQKCLQVVIVTGKEFSQLVFKECEELAVYLNLTLIKSNGDFNTNVKLLYNGAQVIIGNPESIIKLLQSVSRPISPDFKSIVIDNGEEVFLKESAQFIDEIMRRLPPNRQILLFTSDMMGSITKFKKDYLKNAAEFDFLKDLVSNGRTDKASSHLVKKSTDVPKAANMTEKLPSRKAAKTKKIKQDISDPNLKNGYKNVNEMPEEFKAVTNQYLSFEDFGLNKDLLKRISELNWEPLYIDKSVLPNVFNDRNILVYIERENMDKVATYLISVLNRINPIKKTLQVIIVTSKQFNQLVFERCADLSMYLNLSIIKCGYDFNTNLKLFNNGAQVIIGHPEGIMELFKSASRPVSSDFKSIVIDNGEEVFLKESAQFIDEIMRRLPPNRQILLFASEIRNYTVKFKKEHLLNAAKFDFMDNLISDATTDKAYHLDEKTTDVVKAAKMTEKLPSRKPAKTNEIKQDISDPNLTNGYQNVNEMPEECKAETNQYLSFEEFGLNKDLLKRILELNWAPLCIDKMILPTVSNDNNILVHIERENMDKVATYLVSVLNRINPIKKCLQVIIVTSKEFSQLVFERCADLAMYLNLTMIKSDDDFNNNIDLLNNGADVIIGHPEEVMELLINSSRPVYHDFKSIVIDNGEELFLKNSKQYMDALIRRLPPNRQILLFTSEVIGSISEFRDQYLKNASEFDFINDLVSDATCDEMSHCDKKSIKLPEITSNVQSVMNVSTKVTPTKVVEILPSQKQLDVNQCKQNITNPSVSKDCKKSKEKPKKSVVVPEKVANCSVVRNPKFIPDNNFDDARQPVEIQDILSRGVGQRFELKKEKEWCRDVTLDPDLFKIDFDYLNQKLSNVPFYKCINLDVNLYSKLNMEIMDDISKDEENETSVENNNSCGDIINEDPVDAAKQPEDIFEIDKILNNCRDSDGGEIVADVENKRNFSNLADSNEWLDLYLKDAETR